MMGSWFVSRPEVAEDLAHGQVVIVSARWVLVLAGLALALWNPGSLVELRVQLFVILVMAVVNFYLHTQLLARKPTLDQVVWGATAADLTVVTLLIATQGGYPSHLYIFYFPAILALSVAFPSRLTVLYTATTAGAYTILAFATTTTQSEAQTIVSRVIVLAAIAWCGHCYRTIERNRRSRWEAEPVRIGA